MSNKLYIPRLGDQLRLTADWGFKLVDESRNYGLFEHLRLKRPAYDGRNECPYSRPKSVDAQLPAGALLKVDRIFIRKGAAEFDSVTFLLVGEKTKKRQVSSSWGTYVEPARAVRFWVKLDHANNINFESAE